MAQNTFLTDIITLGAFAIVLSLGLATPSVFAGDTSGGKSGKTIVLTGDHAGEGTLGLDTEIEETSTNNGVGSQDLFNDDLRYKQDGEVAGRNSGVCITTSPFGTPNDPRPAFQGANLCSIGFVLFGRGKITVSGIVTNDDFTGLRPPGHRGDRRIPQSPRQARGEVRSRLHRSRHAHL